MKRFVTYLYECERGSKSKNVGFARINLREDETNMEVYLRNLRKANDTAEIFGLVYEGNLKGIKLSELKIQNGQGDCRITFLTENIMNSKYTIEDVLGIGIRFESGIYVISCWKEIYVDEMLQGEFDSISERVKTETIDVETDFDVEETGEIEDVISVKEITNEEAMCEKIIYEKIDLSQIRDLPSPNWHLVTNSFLVHGFWNHGYLVLKKEMEEGQEKLALGVPGVYEKPEAVMAVFFGFPIFTEISKDIAQTKMNEPIEIIHKEKNQEAESGTFGCWFANLKV